MRHAHASDETDPLQPGKRPVIDGRPVHCNSLPSPSHHSIRTLVRLFVKS
jgi:hypothetical protein